MSFWHLPPGRALAGIAPARLMLARIVLTRLMLTRVMLMRAMLASSLVVSAVPASLMPADVAIADTASRSQTEEFTQLAAGPGRDLTAGRCIICHSLEYIPSNAPAMNRAGWEKTVQKMRDRFGAPMTDEEARQILDYLANNYSGKP